jgi:hypothetical protein
METPGEWAKRFNQQTSSETADAPKLERAVVESSASAAEFPSEPFQCPACGQLLGPSCRVCVSCKQPINPAEIARTSAVPLAAAHVASAQPRPQSVRFSWPIFFAVLGASCLIALIVQGLWKDQQQVFVAMGAVQTLASVWVFFDAHRRGIPRPLRWSLGTMFLPIVIFPWYLTRRRTPQLPVPFLEAIPIIRLLLIAVLLLVLANLIASIVQGPLHPAQPVAQPRTQTPAENPPSRITRLRPLPMDGRQPGIARNAPAPAVSI